MASVNQLNRIASILRRDVLKITTEAGSGHPTTCLSSAEIMSVLFFSEMKYDINYNNPDNDEFILSKGHAAPILYSSLFRANCINEDLMSLRKSGSLLEGHPIPNSLGWIKAATGSLGQGLSIGIGMAIASKLQKRNYMTYVLLGDSETAEGSVYEALQLAVHYKLNNLCAILDVNRLGQSGETMIGHDILKYKERFLAFGWNIITVNGHDVRKLVNAFKEARSQSRKPTVIIARTIKGKGISFLEDKDGWHGKTLSEEQLNKALKEIPETHFPKIEIERPLKINVHPRPKFKLDNTVYKIGELFATREAYGNALYNLTKSDPYVVVTDAEVKNSTYSQVMINADPKRFIEAYIAEQNMIGMALGLSVKGFNVFASTFSCFLSRVHDQIRMSALSSANFTICGSHCGVSVGEDGASQMGLEDISLFRCLPNSIVLYPSDAVSCEKLVYLAHRIKGLKYIRTTRPKTPVIYSNKEEFKLGDFKVVRKNNNDKIVLVGSGITLYECLKAHEELKENKINTSVVDLYCVKPFDINKFKKFVKNKKVLVVEDHYKEGGIGEMLSSYLNVNHLCIKEMPHSGNMEELMHKYGIDTKTIVSKVKKMLKRK